MLHSSNMRLSLTFSLCALLLVGGAESSDCPADRDTFSKDNSLCRLFEGQKVSCPSGWEFWFRNDCGCGCRAKVCGEDKGRCPDGSTVARDPERDCEFQDCRPAPLIPAVVCPKDEKTCVDGTVLARDPENNCEFPQCTCPPRGWVEMEDKGRCMLRHFRNCPEGYAFKQADECGCGCRPHPVFCMGSEKKVCPDGPVQRDPLNNCEFPKCKCPPKEWTRSKNMCMQRKYVPCESGTEYWSHAECGCGCKPIICPKDKKPCLDGSVVVRNPANNCEFPKCECPPEGWRKKGDPQECKTLDFKCKGKKMRWSDDECGCGCTPPVTCKEGKMTCPDGSTVVRNAATKCRWQKCDCHPHGWTRFGDRKKCKQEAAALTCEPGYEPWTHKKCGCGCKPVGAGAL